MSKALLEICVDSVAGLDSAIRGGADRIELCAALDIGGLTPTWGLMALASKAPIPVYAMIRPSAGAFIFDEVQEAVMTADIMAAREVGLAGVVIGANKPDGTLDVPMLTRLMGHAKGLGVTLHRAFDLVPDHDVALEQAVEIGFERILTSGGTPKAMDGIETIRRMVEKAGDRLIIMPGSGVRPENVLEILARTGAKEIHGSGRGPLPQAPDARSLAFSFQTANAMETDVVTVRKIQDLLA